jgi:hypothetical protein
MATAILMSMLMNIVWMYMITDLTCRMFMSNGSYSDTEKRFHADDDDDTNDNDNFTKEKDG